MNIEGSIVAQHINVKFKPFEENNTLLNRKIEKLEQATEQVQERLREKQLELDNLLLIKK